MNRNMSGIEVAGIVLAVLPLCISALEYYEGQIKAYKALFRYHRELSKSTQELDFAYNSFMLTIQDLYAKAEIADREEFEEMMKKSTTISWPTNDSEPELKQYLSDRVYEMYKFKTNQINDMIVEIASVVGADVSTLVNKNGLQGVCTVRRSM